MTIKQQIKNPTDRAIGRIFYLHTDLRAAIGLQETAGGRKAHGDSRLSGTGRVSYPDGTKRPRAFAAGLQPSDGGERSAPEKTAADRAPEVQPFVSERRFQLGRVEVSVHPEHP